MNKIIEEEKKRGRGRPRQDVHKDNGYNFRMDDEELANLEKLCERLGKSKADTLRLGLKFVSTMIDEM